MRWKKEEHVQQSAWNRVWDDVEVELLAKIPLSKGLRSLPLTVVQPSSNSSPLVDWRQWKWPHMPTITSQSWKKMRLLAKSEAPLSRQEVPVAATTGNQLDSSAVSLLKGETEGESCSRSMRHSQAHRADWAAGLKDRQKRRNVEQTSGISLKISGKKSQGLCPLKTLPKTLLYPIRAEALKLECMWGSPWDACFFFFF